MQTLLNQLSIEPSLLAGQIVAFLIFAALFWRFAQKPLLNILDERKADIQATYDQLDADRDAMMAARRDYEQRLAGIEAEAREQIQTAVKEAQVLRNEIIADAHKQAESIIERGGIEIEREREKAFMEMRQQIVALSVAAAGKIIGESMDSPRHTKLVDEFITLAAKGEVGSAGTSSGNGTGQKGSAA